MKSAKIIVQSIGNGKVLLNGCYTQDLVAFTQFLIDNNQRINQTNGLWYNNE